MLGPGKTQKSPNPGVINLYSNLCGPVTYKCIDWAVAGGYSSKDSAINSLRASAKKNHIDDLIIRADKRTPNLIYIKTTNFCGVLPDEPRMPYPNVLGVAIDCLDKYSGVYEYPLSEFGDDTIKKMDIDDLELALEYTMRNDSDPLRYSIVENDLGDYYLSRDRRPGSIFISKEKMEKLEIHSEPEPKDIEEPEDESDVDPVVRLFPEPLPLTLVVEVSKELVKNYNDVSIIDIGYDSNDDCYTANIVIW